MNATEAPHAVQGSRIGVWYLLAVLTLINVLSVVDRTIPAVLIQDIKADLGLSDAQFGLINGAAFTLIYCAFSLPISRLSDRWSRRNVILCSVFFWSLM